MRRFATIFLLLSASLGFTCAGPPVVVNDLDGPITVSSTWDDGSVHEGELPPGDRMYLSDYGHHPTRVTIAVSGRESLTFTAADAPELLAGAVRGTVVGWRVTNDGARPLTESELAE